MQQSNKGYRDEEHLKSHQEKGAEIIAEYLSCISAPIDLVKHVSKLIAKHEIGGNAEQNSLKDADSLSFFETNADGFIKKHLPLVGEAKVREKFNWMYDRISDSQAKQLAKPFYDKIMQEFEKTVSGNR